MQRIDKFLCDQNLGTRKQVKEFIKNGMVTINGETALKPEQHVDETADEISFGGKVLNYSEFRYYMLYKPQDVVSATTDGRSVTVVDLLKPENVKGLAPVGRLDKDTEGLLLMTNDGMLTHNLLSPKKHVDKDYEVHLAHEITDFTVQFRIARLHLFDVLFFFNPYIFQGFFITALQRNAFFNVNTIAGFIFANRFNAIAYLTLQADIGNQAIPRFRIHTRHITGIGISIGITIFYVKQDGKFIAILNGFGHLIFPPFSYTVSGSDGNSLK